MTEGGTRWFIASCAAIFALVLLIVAIVFVPVAGREADLAEIYEMRWSALAAISTVVSAAAIGFTAIYARETIALARRTERTKQTLSLMAAYRRDGISAAFIRYRNESLSATYTQLQMMSDIGTVLAYFEDAALQLEAGIIDRDLFMRHFGDVVKTTWSEFFVPAASRVQPPLVAEDFPEFGELRAQARVWRDRASR